MSAFSVPGAADTSIGGQLDALDAPLNSAKNEILWSASSHQLFVTQLHWLPVRHRITYKVATMAFRCVRGACLAYFTDVCIPVETVAGRAKLRSARHGELILPPTRAKTFGSCSFRSAAPSIWNSLPHHIRQYDVSRGQFASHLKTWLFSCAYA